MATKNRKPGKIPLKNNAAQVEDLNLIVTTVLAMHPEIIFAPPIAKWVRDEFGRWTYPMSLAGLPQTALNYSVRNMRNIIPLTIAVNSQFTVTLPYIQGLIPEITLSFPNTKAFIENLAALESIRINPDAIPEEKYPLFPSVKKSTSRSKTSPSRKKVSSVEEKDSNVINLRHISDKLPSPAIEKASENSEDKYKDELAEIFLKKILESDPLFFYEKKDLNPRYDDFKDDHMLKIMNIVNDHDSQFFFPHHPHMENFSDMNQTMVDNEAEESVEDFMNNNPETVDFIDRLWDYCQTYSGSSGMQYRDIHHLTNLMMEEKDFFYFDSAPDRSMEHIITGIDYFQPSAEIQATVQAMIFVLAGRERFTPINPHEIRLIAQELDREVPSLDEIFQIIAGGIYGTEQYSIIYSGSALIAANKTSFFPMIIQVKGFDMPGEEDDFFDDDFFDLD